MGRRSKENGSSVLYKPASLDLRSVSSFHKKADREPWPNSTDGFRFTPLVFTFDNLDKSFSRHIMPQEHIFLEYLTLMIRVTRLGKDSADRTRQTSAIGPRSIQRCALCHHDSFSFSSDLSPANRLLVNSRLGL